MRRQVRLVVGGEEFFIDLLFYHCRLRCFVVVEPEDRPSIGMILCRSKNRVVVEYSLHATGKPIGVASYTLAEELERALRAR